MAWKQHGKGLAAGWMHLDLPAMCTANIAATEEQLSPSKAWKCPCTRRWISQISQMFRSDIIAA